ncbi:MAG TPA: YciI family protein [Thermomicrobiales bacterium]|nr:YciI family protein [Thermomicrobiales bacterium]
MANYLVMIYDNEAEWARADASVAEEVSRQHMEFARRNGAALRGGARLGSSATATSIRHGRDGTTTLTDGTFAETKEVLAGYYVIEAADLDEALEIAKQVPARFGGVEVRPIIPD